jgi:hypothetical protein
MSYVHWQFQTAQGQAKVLTHEEFATADLDKVLAVMSVEEKIHMLAVSNLVNGSGTTHALISFGPDSGHELVDDVWGASARYSSYQDVGRTCE